MVFKVNYLANTVVANTTNDYYNQYQDCYSTPLPGTKTNSDSSYSVPELKYPTDDKVPDLAVRSLFLEVLKHVVVMVSGRNV